MRSFIKVNTKRIKITNEKGMKEDAKLIYPTFSVTGKDIMKKGGKFYAILDKDTGFWVKDEGKVYEFIDKELYLERDRIGKEYDSDGIYRDNEHNKVIVSSMDDSSTKQYVEYSNWFNRLPPNHNYKQLDNNITFVEDEVSAEMYRTKRLPYSIGDGDISAYEKLMGTLYSEDDRRKIEWSIGSVFLGDSKKNEKFMVLYGDPGTGKSTILDLIKALFEGYYGIFVASDLANKAYSFATSAFKDNPLVAIQDDGSLRKIDSPTINEIISHKEVMINEKNKSQYPLRCNAMLFMATNELVDLHDTKLGITRRLLDVYPTGNKLPVTEYRKLNKELYFELGAIAKRCIEVYKELGKEYYEGYEPSQMIKKTNYLRNFIFDNFDKFKDEKILSRDVAYKWYKEYCTESGITYIQKRIDFGEQLKEYYDEFYDMKWIDGKSRRNVYLGFRIDKFDYISDNGTDAKTDKFEVPDWLKMRKRSYGALDVMYPDAPAQYAKDDGTPSVRWSDVKTTLKEIMVNKLHYVKVPENLVVIDFDIKDKNGNKSFEKNLEAASKWPITYAEVSKSGEGIHLHYIYNGDTSKLKMLYDKDIEIKAFRGKSALRRMVTKCNNEEIAIISSGLPEKGEEVVSDKTIKDEKHLRALIAKALRKEVFPNTKPCMDFILKVTDDAYKNSTKFDITDLRPDIMAFANNSTHQASYCLNILNKIHWQSEEEGLEGKYTDDSIIFFDVEVFPNLFVICWKELGEEKKVVRMTNPSPSDVEELTKHKLVGFNNREYDNHILYARIMGYNNYQLYELSHRLIAENDKSAKFREAYKLSYTDIYDYAAKKQGLKKWEIELGIHHQELGFPWDKPVPKDKWELVAEYCDNDVLATEAVWNATQGDFLAREILADLSGLTVNDTTNQCTTRIIVGTDRDPQSEFIYTDLSTIYPGYEFNAAGIDKSRYNEGTKIVQGKSLYFGEDPGEGGYVYAEPGIYTGVGLLDVVSEHPHSAIRLNIFGPYTKNFKDLVDARVHIKRGEYEEAGEMLDGKLQPYLKDKTKAKALAQALKIAINSVYGLTSAKFDNKLRDPRNKDNIVAKYGALFMITLKREVQKRGYKVIHIKTDSIKIANMDNKIKDFCMKFATKYGFEFEHEATYEKICLVNESTYICKDQSDGHWSATGTQFQVPYVFKTMFSHESIKFDDLCTTNSVTSALYLDMNENLKDGEHNYVFIGRVGQFTPIKPGCGGGLLVREARDKEGNIKYDSANGCKGYRWLESEQVRMLNKYDDVDASYFNRLVEEAVDTIEKFGSYRDFVSDDVPDFLKIPDGATEPSYDFMNPPE